MGEVIPLFGGAGGTVPPVRESAAAGPGSPSAPRPAQEPRGSSGSLRERSESKGLEPSPGSPSEFTPIEHASLDALGRRGVSRRELEAILARQGYHEFAIADELDRLEGVGLIDDYALAQHLVAHLQERKGMTGGAIKAELVKRIVAPGAIDYAMDLIDTADELERAREIAETRARQYGSLDPATVERRLTAFLLRRGFTASTVRAAVRSVRSA